MITSPNTMGNNGPSTPSEKGSGFHLFSFVGKEMVNTEEKMFVFLLVFGEINLGC